MSCIPRRTTLLYFIWLLSSPIVEDLSAELDFVLLPDSYRRQIIEMLASSDGLTCPGTDNPVLDSTSLKLAIKSMSSLTNGNFSILCPKPNDDSDASKRIDGSLTCSGIQMVGWLPDLFSDGVVLPNLTAFSTIGPSIPLAFLIIIEHILNANLYASMIKGELYCELCHFFISEIFTTLLVYTHFVLFYRNT